MPFALYLLGLAVFAQATSEFMLSGLIPGIAADLSVSVPAAGGLTSAFAVGMVIGAPLMAALSLRWSPRRALLGFLTVFLLVHVLGAVTGSYPVLLASRVAGALANAGFLAVALATAVGMVEPKATGRATSILLGGTTLACVLGVPAGAALGQLWGWRSAFWAVAVISLPALLAILRTVPGDTGGARIGVRAELAALRGPRLLRLLGLGALVNGGTFCGFTYLAQVVTEVSALPAGWVPPVLMLFGAGSFAGVSLAGRISDTHPNLLLLVGGLAGSLGWTGWALTAASPVWTVIFAFTQGFLSFAVGSTLIALVLGHATAAPRLAGGLATAALNVGAAAGPWLGGLAITAGFGYRAPLWVSALLTLAALLIAGVTIRARRTGTAA